MVYLLSFFLVLCYNYYGDNMNSSDIIISIKNMKDTQKITADTKYINMDINEVSTETIDYFLLNGGKYSYSDSINGRDGFIYAGYDMFKFGETIVDNIIDNMPGNLNKLEMVRYIYISLGRILCTDINAMEDKNEIISFSKISTINNIWGALSSRRVNDATISKIFMYICARIGIKCELINGSIKGNVCNKVYLEDSFIVIDLFNDIYNIQGGFVTKYFDKYNDNKEIDKKILYIYDEYMNYYVDRVLKDFDYNGENVLYEMLSLTSKVINISNIGPYELFKIYKEIFDKYIPNYNIKINNLFVYRGLDIKEHFTLFSYNDNYYSFNYNKNCFVGMDIDVLNDNISSSKIGIYDGEDFNMKERSVVL